MSLPVAVLAVLFALPLLSQNPAPDAPRAEGRVIAPGAKLEQLAGGFAFTEGPTSDSARERLLLRPAEQPDHEVDGRGPPETFLQPAGRANGMYFDAAGNLLACADEKTELWSIAPDGTHTVLAGEFEGRRFNGPNDVWGRPDGSVYFTDPFYPREWWDYDAKPQDASRSTSSRPTGRR